MRRPRVRVSALRPSITRPVQKIGLVFLTKEEDNMINERIGTQYGIYKILSNSDTSAFYKVQCMVCGKIMTKSWSSIKRCPQNCQHEEKIEHNCQCCGKQLTIRKKETVKEFNNRKYCCLSCANKMQQKKPMSTRTKEILSEKNLEAHNNTLDYSEYIDGFKSIYFENRFITLWNKDCYKKDKIENIDYVICPYCGTRFKQIQSGHLSLHNKTMQDLFKEFGLDFKTMSDYTFSQHSMGTKKAIEEAIKNGKELSWAPRPKESYPEKYWMEVLDNNNIKYKREYVVYQKDLSPELGHCFFLDFLIDGYIDLEIDGKQHLEPERIEHDKKRNKLLEDNGYIVYRIPWISPRYKPLQVQKQINDFLEWYNKQKTNT